jgi:acyl-CoA synthetase (AMP-forming)/AMP-acid ligase II
MTRDGSSEPRVLHWDPASLPESLRTGLLGSGTPFEMRDELVLGVPTPVFVQRPPHVPEALRRSAAERGDLGYLVSEDRTLSFADTATHAARIARRLQDDFGVEQGDRVAIAAANSLAYAVCWWAIVSCGAIVVGLNGWWAAPELAYGVELTTPKLVLADEKRLARLRETGMQRDIPLVDLDAVLADAHGHAGTDRADLPNVAIAEDDPVIVLFTSGTTGRPKGAVLSHRNVCHVAMAVALGGAVLALTTDPPPPPSDAQPTSLLASPLFHISGTLPLAVGAFFGSRLVFPPPGPWDASGHLDLTVKHGVTSWSGVPTQLWRLLEHPDLSRYDLGQIRTVGGGGAMFPPALRDLLAEKLPHVSMSTGYGMTETFGSGTRLWGPWAERHPASVGAVEPGNEVRVLGPNGEVLPEGEVGEISIRSSAVFLGYWDDPEATAAVLDERRWYRTGDFGRIVDDVLYLESRMRDLIIRGGENIYPIEVENRLMEHPDIDDACVVGVEHRELGQEIAAVLVPRSGATLDPEAIRAWVGDGLAAFKVPAHVVVRDSLPYTETGKLVKSQVEADISTLLAPS